MEEFSAMIGG